GHRIPSPMTRECSVGYFGPGVDGGEKAVLPPALDAHAASESCVANVSIPQLHLGIERSGVIGLALLDLEASFFEIAVVVRRITPQQERWETIVVVDSVGVVEKGGKSAPHRRHAAGTQPLHGGA